jgi:hypothetical protein
MLQFIASNINSISAIIAVLFAVGVMGSCFCAIKPYCDEYADTLATVALLSAIIGVTLLFNISKPYPVSNAPWKTIYKNDLNANIQIDYKDSDDSSDKYTLETGKTTQNIQKFQSRLEEANVFSSVQLTVTKGDDSVAKTVMLENKNLIAKNVDLNNARIVKIEYRPLEGETRKVFGIKGKTESTNKDGEIRITFESNNNKQLENLFKD